MKFFSKGGHRGFTIIELLIAIGVISILTAVSLPGIKSWVHNARLKSAARDLYSNFQRAKLEAVKRNTTVTIAFTEGFGQTGEYQVFIDNGDGSGTAGNESYETSEPLIVQNTMPINVTLGPVNFGGSPPKKACFYTSKGLPWKSRIGKVVMKNDNSLFYKVVLSSAGYVRLQKSADGSNWN